MIHVEHVGKTFGSYVALASIDLRVEPGEFICLLGPSGCGKSTLLNLVAGFDQPTTGTVRVGGKPVRGPGRDRVVVFQDAGSALLPWQTVEENIRFGLSVRAFPKAEWPDRTNEALHMVDLALHRAKFPAQLSGGMRQRLQIARALAVEPQVLLMDEPFGALDAMTRRRMHRVLLDIWQRTDKTILFVTHDITEALVLADRICIMSMGPASTIATDLRIDTPRPRDLADPALARRVAEIEAYFDPQIAYAEGI